MINDELIEPFAKALIKKFYENNYQEYEFAESRSFDPCFNRNTNDSHFYHRSPHKKRLNEILRPQGFIVYQYTCHRHRRRTQFMTLNMYQEVKVENATHRSFLKQNRSTIQYQKNMIKCFKQMFNDNGITITIKGTNDFNTRNQIIHLFDRCNLTEIIQNYQVIDELKGEYIL